MNVHFVGIGGIGTSALAKYYLSQGAKVSGSDLKSSEITNDLGKHDANIFIGEHKKENLAANNIDKLIYTSAVAKLNPEIKEAKKRKIKIQSYAEALGELTKKYETITISGMHGKSTTTALTSLILIEGYYDPTVIVGTKLKEFDNSNFRLGHGPHLILEADEWNRSFLKYYPKIAIITTLDLEHLDTYRDLEEIEQTFADYLAKVPDDGKIIANADDKLLKKMGRRFGKKTTWYSLQDKDALLLRKFLRIPGEHNVSNALASAKLAEFLGIRWTDIIKAVSEFTGTWRRFEFKGITPTGAYIFSDYAHHPTEISKTILAARSKFPLRRIWCVYQPHQYQRLAHLWDDFKTAFDMADRITLLPVYDVAGRETKIAKLRVDSRKLAEELSKRAKNVGYLDSFEQVQDQIQQESKNGDIVLIMGAGDIYTLTDRIIV